MEFIFALRYRLGLPVFETEGVCPMARCNSNSDRFGDHAITCAINGERISKHNHLRDAIFNAGVQARLGPQKEPAGLIPGSDERPADVFFPFWTQGKDTALDITVVNPLQAGLVQRTSRDGGSGVEHAYLIKMRKYFDRCEGEGIVFTPMAVDTFGGWHPAALAILTKLGRQVARGVGKEEADVVRQLRQRLGVLLVRDNMSMVNSRAPSFPPANVDGDVDED